MKRTHLKIVQGTPFRLVITVKAKNETTGELEPMLLPGCVARLQARTNVASPTLLLDLSSDGKGITLDEETGVITVELTSSDTSALDWDPKMAARPVYQCEIERPGDDDIRILEGTIQLDREVVR